MKKIIFSYLVLTIVVTGVTSTWAKAVAGGADVKAKALSVQGDVYYKAVGQDWRTLSTGDLVATGSQINTGSNASVDLAIGEKAGSAVKIDSGSRVAIASLDSVNIRLGSGSILSVVKELPDRASFQIHTPLISSTVSSGNAGFTVSTDTIEVYGKNGSPVKIETISGETAMIQPGTGYRITSEGVLGKAYEIKDSRLYEDFNGQIHDYRWAIPGTSEYKAGASFKNDDEVSATDKKDKDAEAQTKKSSVKEEAQKDKDQEAAAEKAKKEPKNLPIPDQEPII